MKKHLLCVCIVVATLLAYMQTGFAAENVSKTARAADLPDPIRERLLEGDNRYEPPFDFLNDNDKMDQIVIELLVWNSRTDANAKPPAEIPDETRQDNNMRGIENGVEGVNPNYEALGKVVKVYFDTGTKSVTVEPTFKWLVVGATYGVLPTSVGSSEFLGWFTAPDGGDRITPESLTSTSVKTLYAHWKQNDTVKFNDVQENSTFYAPIYWAVQNRITKGTSATQFSPTAQCTRKQIIIFLWRAATQPSDDNANNFSAAMEWAYQNGILSKSDRNFDKEAPCTRMEAMTYLWKQCGQPYLGTEETKVALGAFSDVNADDAYAVAVAWAVKNGITKGTSDVTFSPNNTCTRGQIVTFLYRAYADNLLAIG